MAVHDRLRAILAPHRTAFSVTDHDRGMTLELPGQEGKPWGFVAGTRVGKRYVSFHLMSAYAEPALLEGMSPALRRRMQGKSCFNFTKIDEPLLADLEALTEKGIERQPEIIAKALAERARRR